VMLWSCSGAISGDFVGCPCRMPIACRWFVCRVFTSVATRFSFVGFLLSSSSALVSVAADVVVMMRPPSVMLPFCGVVMEYFAPGSDESFSRVPCCVVAAALFLACCGLACGWPGPQYYHCHDQ
jgi:hypothetical protein